MAPESSIPATRIHLRRLSPAATLAPQLSDQLRVFQPGRPLRLHHSDSPARIPHRAQCRRFPVRTRFSPSPDSAGISTPLRVRGRRCLELKFSSEILSARTIRRLILRCQLSAPLSLLLSSPKDVLIFFHALGFCGHPDFSRCRRSAARTATHSPVDAVARHHQGAAPRSLRVHHGVSVARVRNYFLARDPSRFYRQPTESGFSPTMYYGRVDRWLDHPDFVEPSCRPQAARLAASRQPGSRPATRAKAIPSRRRRASGIFRPGRDGRRLRGVYLSRLHPAPVSESRGRLPLRRRSRFGRVLCVSPLISRSSWPDLDLYDRRLVFSRHRDITQPSPVDHRALCR